MTSSTYFRQNAFGTLEFYCLMTFAVCGMLLLTMAQELITVFIALEIVSLSIYILVGYNRKSVKSSEAVLKYLMLGAFAGAFFTMGTALVYGATGSTSFAAIAAYISRDGFLANPALAGGVPCSSFSPCSSRSPSFPSMPGWSMSMTGPRCRSPASWPPP